MRFPGIIQSCILLFLTIPSVAKTQDWQWVRDDLLINPSGVQSFGSAGIDLGDIDGDSWLDLVVLDSVSLRMYQNRGLENSIGFIRRPDWEIDARLTSLENGVPTLADLNGDGRADLIVPGRKTNSLKYWRNTGEIGNGLWARDDSIVQALVSYRFVAFADLDSDDDLDAITLQDVIFVDRKLRIYWNTGDPTIPTWQLDPEAITLRFGDETPNNVRFADIDDDGIPDLFSAHDWAWKDALVGVGRSSGSSDSLEFVFPPVSRTLLDARGITLAVGDIDHDGNIDLLTGHEMPFLYVWNSDFDPARNAFYQKGNLGFPFGYLESGIALYDLEQNGSGEMILVHPELPSDIPSALLSFTKFSRQNSLWLRDPDFRFFFEDYFLSNPTLDRVDWDGDGVFELILGVNKVVASMTQTILMFFTNGEPQPDFFSDFSPDSLFHDPALVDINDDGMLDLFLQKSGHYLFYENAGTLLSPNWEARPQWSQGLTKIKYYRAEIGDLTQDGLQDIVFGEEDGSLSFWRNVGNQLLPRWEPDDRVFVDVGVDSFAIPTLVDLDFDDDLDLILGDRLGRFHAFRNDFVTSVSVGTMESENPEQPFLFQNYPNPFNASTTIQFAVAESRRVTVRVYDVLGREVETLLNKKLAAGLYNLKWTPEALPSGTYFIRIAMGEFVLTRKAILQK